MTGIRRARVLVFGTGAMGNLFAAHLAHRGGCDVTVTGGWREGLETIARQGISVEEGGGRWTASPAVRSLDELDSAFDVVLVLTKSRRTAAIAVHAVRAASGGGTILTLQNGLGNREILAAAGASRVAGGVTAIGATLLEAGRVRLGGRGATVIGGRDVTRAELDRLRRLLTAAGFPAEITGDLPRAVWTKLAVNCSINPISAIAGLANGELVAGEVWRREIRSAAREVGRVAAARGIVTRRDLGRHALDVARATASNRSSMLQDLLAGRPTEIDALCGAVAGEARKLGVPAPVNSRLAARVRALEQRREQRP